jgi:hypothetical protein
MDIRYLVAGKGFELSKAELGDLQFLSGFYSCYREIIQTSQNLA